MNCGVNLEEPLNPSLLLGFMGRDPVCSSKEWAGGCSPCTILPTGKPAISLSEFYSNWSGLINW